MFDYILIDHDGNVQRVDSIKDIDRSYLRSILELDVEGCGSYAITIKELLPCGKVVGELAMEGAGVDGNS